MPDRPRSATHPLSVVVAGGGTAAATAAACRAPTLLAIPALALASWTTTGTREPGSHEAR